MDFNRVSACKSLLLHNYNPEDGVSGLPGEAQEAYRFLQANGLSPWGRGVSIRTDMFGNAQGGLDEHTIQPWMKEKVFVLVDSIELLADIATEAVKAGACVVDLESQGLDTRIYDGKPNHGIVGIALCFDSEVGYYVPCRHVPEQDDVAHPENGNLPFDKVKPHLQRILDGCICVYHNAPFDTELLYGEGFEVPEDPAKFDDTQIMGWLVDSNRKRISLKAMSADLLDQKMIEFKDLFPKEAKKLKFEMLHPQETYIYASSDGICTYQLYQLFLADEILQRQKLIWKVEKMLVPVLRRMSRNRFHINVDYLQELDKDLSVRAKQLVEDIRRLVGDDEFNVDSPKQLGEVLFDKLKIPNAGKTPSGKQWKTDRQVLEDLDKKHRGKYPALTMVVKYRQLQKLRGTYISNLCENLDQFKDGRFGIQACGAPTGRFAAPGGKPDQGYTGVNSQAVPKVKKDKPNIRKAFVARPGFVIAAIDFAGVELRIAGNLSKEPKWINEFNHQDCKNKYDGDYEVVDWSPLWHHCPYCREKMGDVHSQTAEAVFGSSTEEHRNKSKGVNFGILYGAGGKTIGENVGVSKDEGYRIVKSFKDALPGIAKWIRKQHRTAHRTGMVTTAFGRVRLIPEVKSEHKGTVGFGERTSVNTSVQGTSADITKIAMVGCAKLIRSKGWQHHCRILLTVHDELVFEVRREMLDEILPALGLAMSKCNPKGWAIPLTVDIEWGENWGELVNNWKPPAPRVIPRREGVPPLWDDESQEKPEQSPAVESPPQETTTETTPEAATPPPAVEEPAPPEPSPAPTETTPTTDTGVMDFIVKRPYTKHKWRKLEALFVLAGEGSTKLRILSDTGGDLTGRRVIRVDPVYFRYKAQEWGL